MYGFIADAATPTVEMTETGSLAVLGIGIILVLVIGLLLVGLCVFLIVFNVKKSNRRKAEAARLAQGADACPVGGEVVFAGAPDENAEVRPQDSTGESPRE